MNTVEKISISIRHAPGLHKADWLWKRIRPVYDRYLQLVYSRRGLVRVVNGEGIIVCPGSRRFITKSYEPKVWRRAMREVHAGDTVVEVGANMGIYTLAFASRVGESGRVVAFEPDPVTASELDANIAVNGWGSRIIVRRAAAGDSLAEVSFIAGREMESHIAFASESQARSNGTGKTITVPMVTLDSVFPDSCVNLLKIDVEGFEEPVLRGAIQLLADRARRPHAIIVEMHPFAWEAVGTSSDSILGVLTGAGYRVESLEGAPVEHIESYGHVIAHAT